MDWPSNELGFCSVLSVKRMGWMNVRVKIATTHSYMRKMTQSEKQKKRQKMRSALQFTAEKLKFDRL